MYYTLYSFIYNMVTRKMEKEVLDITNYSCPMTFLKTKEFIRKNLNAEKIILIRGKKDSRLLSNNLKKNFSIEIFEKGDDVFEIRLK